MTIIFCATFYNSNGEICLSDFDENEEEMLLRADSSCTVNDGVEAAEVLQKSYRTWKTR